jgi:hypothetical protein
LKKVLVAPVAWSLGEPTSIARFDGGLGCPGEPAAFTESRYITSDTGEWRLLAISMKAGITDQRFPPVMTGVRVRRSISAAET